MVFVCFGSRSELHWFVVFCLKILCKIELKKTEGIVTLELLCLLLEKTKNEHYEKLDVRPATAAKTCVQATNYLYTKNEPRWEREKKILEDSEVVQT